MPFPSYTILFTKVRQMLKKKMDFRTTADGCLTISFFGVKKWVGKQWCRHQNKRKLKKKDGVWDEL